jgi:hypothetical protein
MHQWRLCTVVLAACVTGGCAPYAPPFTRVAPVSIAAVQPAAGRASVVFLWPSMGCDPGGYYTLATAAGLFLGNVSTGTQLRVEMPAGDHTIMGWNPLQEDALGEWREEPVPVLRARIAPGRTYYVRLGFGEWDKQGPPVPFKPTQAPTRGCIMPGLVMTSALLAMTPASTYWSELPAWTATLATTVPDRAAGQAWLEGHRDVLEAHRELAEQRLQGLRPQARKLATLEAQDGIALAP